MYYRYSTIGPNTVQTDFLRYDLAITNNWNIKGTMAGVKKDILVSLVNMVGVQFGLCLRSNSLLGSTWCLDLEIGIDKAQRTL